MEREYQRLHSQSPRSFKNAATGEYETDFINITLWEGIARNVVEYCGKGAIIGVKGRLVIKHTKFLIINQFVSLKLLLRRSRLFKQKPLIKKIS